MDSTMTCDVSENGVPFTILLCILLLGMCIGYFLARYMITKMLERVKREKSKRQEQDIQEKLERSYFPRMMPEVGMFPMPSVNVQDLQLSLDRMTPEERDPIFEEDSEIQPVESTEEDPVEESEPLSTPEPDADPIEKSSVETIRDPEPEPEPESEPEPLPKPTPIEAPMVKSPPKKKTRTTKAKTKPAVSEDSIVTIDSGVTETVQESNQEKFADIEI